MEYFDLKFIFHFINYKEKLIVVRGNEYHHNKVIQITMFD